MANHRGLLQYLIAFVTTASAVVFCCEFTAKSQ